MQTGHRELEVYGNRDGKAGEFIGCLRISAEEMAILSGKEVAYTVQLRPLEIHTFALASMAMCGWRIHVDIRGRKWNWGFVTGDHGRRDAAAFSKAIESGEDFEASSGALLLAKESRLAKIQRPAGTESIVLPVCFKLRHAPKLKL